MIVFAGQIFGKRVNDGCFVRLSSQNGIGSVRHLTLDKVTDILLRKIDSSLKASVACE